MLKIGFGYDIHRIVKDRKLFLGGVNIPSRFGLLGHSDADVLTHAICDALLGAAGLHDIGTQFPDDDPRYKDICSIELLVKVAEKIGTVGRIVNIDSTIIAETPKLTPFIDKMRENIANAIGINVVMVSIKAKTKEKMGPVGRGEAIEAYTVALLEEETP